MGIKEWIMKEKFTTVLVIALILVIGFVYFNNTGNTAMNGGGEGETIALQGAVLKLAFNDQNQPKIFALAENNALAKYKTMEGNPIPERDSMVVGAIEAEMMMDENLFQKAGDEIKGLFGINTKIEGILEKTNTPADYFHFLGSEQYSSLNGKENRAFIIFIESTPKFFIKYDLNEDRSGLKFKEGTKEDYQSYTIVGKKYYPLIIGNTEAEMMKSERIFEKIGDQFEKFGQNFILAGILADTNTAFDLVHITPLNAEELGARE